MASCSNRRSFGCLASERNGFSNRGQQVAGFEGFADVPELVVLVLMKRAGEVSTE